MSEKITFENYQSLAMRTEYPSYAPMRQRLENDKIFSLLHSAMLLSSEYGEIVQAVYGPPHTHKKYVKPHKIDITNLTEELGDMMWAIAEACTALDVKFPVDAYTLKNDRYIYDDNFCSDYIRNLGIKISEFVDRMKRIVFYGSNYPKFTIYSAIIQVTKSIIDLSFYYDIDFETILEKNIKKLRVRYPDKFTEEKALNRNIDKERKTLEGDTNV